MSALFRLLPAMDQVLEHLCGQPGLTDTPRPMLREAAQAFLEVTRQDIRAGLVAHEAQLDTDRLFPQMVAFVRGHVRPRFRRVLNATGVVVHTNLGRSILPEQAARAVHEACRRYSNLEFDLERGVRGSRYSHVEALLCGLTGAQAALVVNNNAAAVLLVLESLAKGREVIVSRGQLVEIGGSFRIPEVMAKSGAVLREVGATNRTHVKDYAQAIGPETAALLKVHTSNFRMVGFTKQVSLDEMAGLAREHGLPVIEDLGGGNLLDLSGLGLGEEPTVAQSVAHGADVVTFSGDKVLGGPQAGIIVGRADLIETIKKNPLNRALRIDKMTLAALEAVLRLYTDPDLAMRQIPTLAMINADPARLKARARTLASRIRREAGSLCTVDTVDGGSQVGGGAFPERLLPTTLVRLAPKALSLDTLRQRLLRTDPPLVGLIEDNTFRLDVRTLADDEFTLVAKALAQAMVE